MAQRNDRMPHYWSLDPRRIAGHSVHGGSVWSRKSVEMQVGYVIGNATRSRELGRIFMKSKIPAPCINIKKRVYIVVDTSNSSTQMRHHPRLRHQTSEVNGIHRYFRKGANSTITFWWISNILICSRSPHVFSHWHPGLSLTHDCQGNCKTLLMLQVSDKTGFFSVSAVLNSSRYHVYYQRFGLGEARNSPFKDVKKNWPKADRHTFSRLGSSKLSFVICVRVDRNASSRGKKKNLRQMLICTWTITRHEEECG